MLPEDNLIPPCTRIHPVFHIQQQNVRSSRMKLRRLILLDASLFMDCRQYVTKLGTGWSTFRFLARRRNLSRPYQLWGPRSFVFNRYPWISFPGVKRPQREADDSPQPKVEVSSHSS